MPDISHHNRTQVNNFRLLFFCYIHDIIINNSNANVLVRNINHTISFRGTKRKPLCLHCYFNTNLRTYADLCEQASRQFYVHFNAIKSNMNCAAAAAANMDPSTLPLERRSCTPKRVSVISLYSPLDYTSWAHQTHHNYSNFALIYSNAVSYLWGNYEHFFFFCKENLSALTKEIVLWKKFAAAAMGGERGKKKAK